MVEKKVPNPVDVHVGARVRLRRLMVQMSQDRLGDQLGVTFQQVQKYERGANRVSASRLWRMSEVLEVPIDFFFDGIQAQSEAGGFADGDETPMVYDFINSTDGVQLASAYSRIADPKVRRQVLQLVRALGNSKTED
ncbi:Transcriptional regulator, Xre family [hydrothermal vent metagenome]|uniref:Transcriptional regulator, Xre family n=1 Tax=hydrothermal vent metagenome TaxID=652676 RepID=A0A3B0S414_9ZZZZ